MKSIIALFTAMLACLFFTQNASAGWSPINGRDGQDCSRKFGSVTNAIGKFCTVNGSNGRIFSNDGFATEGTWSNDGKVTVWINGNCNPNQYIPSDWCFKQFYNMCKNGNKKGEATARYGNGGCQTWHIMVPSYKGP